MGFVQQPSQIFTHTPGYLFSRFIVLFLMKSACRILSTAAILIASIVSPVSSSNPYESIPNPSDSTLANVIPLARHSLTYSNNKTLSYVEAGPPSGPLLVFIHGFPATALTWTSQLSAFASMGFHVVAPDMPSYGQSSFDHVYSDYSIPSTTGSALALLAQLNATSAVWIGHDWGNGPISGLLTHHPNAVRAATIMAMPYHTLDLGLEEGLKTINRTVYPEDRYPYGQWSYQVYYQQSFDNATAWFNADIAGSLKAFYAKGDPPTFRKPAFTADVVRDGGWFGGSPKPLTVDQTPEEATVLHEPLRGLVTAAFEKTSFWAANAWYMNHEINRAYTLGWVNGGVLEMPVLFIEAKYDQVCDTANSELALATLQNTKDLTYVSIDTGHWVQMERPEETTAAIAKWLTAKVPDWWPYLPGQQGNVQTE